jgi:hypothetical protein
VNVGAWEAVRETASGRGDVMAWTEIYQQHFQRYFQKPFDIQVFHGPGGAALKIAIHDWARQGFRVYASMGLADILFRDEEEDFGEVILFADSADKQVPQLFVNALFFILQHNIPLGTPFAIGFGAMDQDFVHRYGKSSLYFTRPVEDDEVFNEVVHKDDVGRVLQAFFVTPEEDAFLEEHGADAFEPKFRAQFGGSLSDEEDLDLFVDKEKAPELEARLQEKWRRASHVLSLRRASCV